MESKAKFLIGLVLAISIIFIGLVVYGINLFFKS
ncbi:hypothetical protein A33I_17265 [Alkalihalophilus marmarensis DSM 21297]|uniref:Uncharacterized protein n=1 Tax=Alkalihalophilus marmarensis DSM 21297 TaxID=1188261 RepID=U6SNN9_9BACI|nr:hypothetical protein A33I_17265 [Alkalihalophilus marmarensis DSM 21297]